MMYAALLVQFCSGLQKGSHHPDGSPMSLRPCRPLLVCGLLTLLSACAAAPTYDRDLSVRALEHPSRNYGGVEWRMLVAVPPEGMRQGDLPALEVYLGRSLFQQMQDRETARRPPFNPIYTAEDARRGMYRAATDAVWLWCREPRLISEGPSSARWTDLDSALAGDVVNEAQYRITYACAPGEVPMPRDEQIRRNPDRNPMRDPRVLRLTYAAKLLRGDGLQFGR